MIQFKDQSYGKFSKKLVYPQSSLECSKQFMIPLSAVSISMVKIQNHFKSWLDYYKVTQTSTIFFNIVFAVILQITNQRLENIGIKLQLRIDKKIFKVLQSKAKGEIMNILDFIFDDDTCLCTDIEEDLRLAIQTFAEVCVLFGLTISVDKTEFMIQRGSNNYTHNELSISIEGENTKQVTSFKYLGSIVTADATINKEIQTRIQKASAAFSKLFQSLVKKYTFLKNKSECVQNNDPPNSDLRFARHGMQNKVILENWRVVNTIF